jgi:hypothetical protein
MTILVLFGGKWQEMAKPRNPNNRNFVIVCDNGDWSGFMTLESAKAKESELAEMKRPNGYFWVEER